MYYLIKILILNLQKIHVCISFITQYYIGSIFILFGALCITKYLTKFLFHILTCNIKRDTDRDRKGIKLGIIMRQILKWYPTSLRASACADKDPYLSLSAETLQRQRLVGRVSTLGLISLLQMRSIS